MGREARCFARWGAQSGEVSVLIEPPGLIARGAFRARTRLDALTNVRAEDGTVRCTGNGEAIELALGKNAERWAAALVAAPPSLAQKLGVTATTRVAIVGDLDDEALAGALVVAPRAALMADADFMLIRTDDVSFLARALDAQRTALDAGTPLWVVYVKGKGAPLGEAAVRATLRERGFIDRKIAAVSERLTALQFVRRVS